MKTLYYRQSIVGVIHDSTIYASETNCPYFAWPSIRMIGSKGCQLCKYHDSVDYQKQTVECSYEETNDDNIQNK